MKRKILIKKLESVGFRFERHGGNHDIYVCGENREEITSGKSNFEKMGIIIHYDRRTFV